MPTPIDWAELLAYTSFTVPAAYVDGRERRLPDGLLLGAGAALAALRALTRGLQVGQVLGAGVGLLALLALWLAARQRLGLGDVKLSALTGFFLGVWGWALALFAASLAGVVYLLARSARGGALRDGSVAFGPFFVAGAVLAFFLAPVLQEVIGL